MVSPTLPENIWGKKSKFFLQKQLGKEYITLNIMQEQLIEDDFAKAVGWAERSDAHAEWVSMPSTHPTNPIAAAQGGGIQRNAV